MTTSFSPAQRRLLAALVGAGATLTLAESAVAEDMADAASEVDVLYVYGTRASYREDDSSSVTRTPTPLEDIPQSVIVITRDVIDDQAMTGLGDLVRYVPGVTMGQGEGHRDAPVFRGNITTSDFFVDGVRDDLQYLRDLYNVERVDVIKGSSALVFGRGTGGGALNRISKMADGDSVRAVDLSLGNFGLARVAGDFGGAFSNTLAGRLNLVAEESETYRDEVEISRLGIAPTLRMDLSDVTRLDFFAEYFSDERTVDRGVPSLNGRPWPGSARTYFGNPDLSNSDIEVATLRGVLTHEMAQGLVALLGDAAHPMRPYLAQGAGMAIEDAAQLERALSMHDLEVPLRLRRYAVNRWQRNARVQARSTRNGRIFHATGPVRWARNLSLKMLGERLLDVPWLYRGDGIDSVRS